MVQLHHRLELTRGDVVLVDVGIVRFVAVAVVIFLQVHVVLADVDVIEVLEQARSIRGRLIIAVGDEFEGTQQRVARVEAQAVRMSVLRAVVVRVHARVVLPRRHKVDLAIVGV